MDSDNVSKTNALKAAFVLAIVAAVVVYAVRQHRGRPATIGERAPEFSVRALSSGTLDLRNYEGKVVVLNLWATWCPPCVEETPSLEQFAEKMRAKGVVVLGVSVDQNEDALREFVAQNHISYPIGRDPNQALSARYGTYQFPESYILDSHGMVAEKIIGAIDWNDDRIQAFVLSLAQK